MIYLASPYSHPTAEGRHARFLAAERVTAFLLQNGHWVYSPIVHCHELARKFDLPADFQFWQAYNEALLVRATSMLVLNIPGWEESKGVRGERMFCHEHSIPVRMVEPDGWIHPEPLHFSLA